MAKLDKKKTDKKGKTEAKAKVAKKANTLDTKKLTPAIPSAKHGPPLSSVEILARVCANYDFFYKSIYNMQAQRKGNKKSKKDESSEASSDDDEKPAVKPSVSKEKVRATSNYELTLSDSCAAVEGLTSES